MVSVTVKIVACAERFLCVLKVHWWEVLRLIAKAVALGF